MRKLAAAVLLLLPLNTPAAQGPSCETEPIPVLKGAYLGQKPPGDRPELFAPGLLSTCREHSAAMFTPDGAEIWLGRMFPSAIYYMKQENGRWTGPRPAPFSTGHDDLYPQLSPDGNRLVFTSTRSPRDGAAALPRGRGQLWIVERTGDGWSEPRHLGPGINFGRRHGGGSVTLSGSLYYSAKGDGSADIYRSVETDEGFSLPERVDALSSDAPDHCPFVAPDESYIVISSFRGGFGLSDLFISFRRQDGSWTEPRNMGSRINSAAKDEYPYVSPDGKYLFFNSNRVSSLNPSRVPDGPGNIWWVDTGIIDELRSDRSKPTRPDPEGDYIGLRPPGRSPEVFAPDVVSRGEAVHGSITFSPDGSEIYWVLQSGNPAERPDLMLVRRRNGKWHDPKRVTAPGPEGVGAIHMSPDGMRLYFVSARPWPEAWGRRARPGTREARKVWYLERSGDGWRPPRALPLSVNQDLDGVCSTRDGMLYASGLRRIRLLPSGEYADPEWLGPPLDVIGPGGAFKGGHPYVSPDESFVLFNDDWPGVRGYGIYLSFKRPDDGWTEPVNILERMGLARGGSAPVLSPDQSYLFYYAAGQFWWVDAGIIEELRPCFR